MSLIRKKISAYAAVASLIIGIVIVGLYAGSSNNPTPAEVAAPPTMQVQARQPGQPEPYFGDLPSLAAVNERESELEEVFSGFRYAWSFEFLSDSEALVTEHAGRLTRLNLLTKETVEINNLPELVPSRGQLGLMDIALHPSFSENQLVYFTYAVQNPDRSETYTTALSRARLNENELAEVTELFRALPYGNSPSNLGGALEFDDDGFLYLAVGDRSVGGNSQRLEVPHGKILRFHDDGRIPDDNPFSTAENKSPVYAYGVRNPQGLYFDSVTGNLYESEHGPMGGDEINIIQAGANYGWPIITYGRNYTTALIGVGKELDGMEQPLYYYLPSPAISPIAVYRGEMFPDWDGHLLVGAMRLQYISKLDLTDSGVRSEQRILDSSNLRIRDIKVATDGSVYILSQQGRLLRLFKPAD